MCFAVEPRKFEPALAVVVGIGCVMHAGYAYGTKDTQEIEVQSKYQIFNKLGTAFAINTSDGRQMIIPASLWYWQFDVPEQWNSMQVGKKYNVDVYGFRIPFLALYPNIVHANERV